MSNGREYWWAVWALCRMRSQSEDPTSHELVAELRECERLVNEVVQVAGSDTLYDVGEFMSASDSARETLDKWDKRSKKP